MSSDLFFSDLLLLEHLLICNMILIIKCVGYMSIHMSYDMRFQQCGMCDQQSLRSACTYAQSDQSLC